MRPRSGVWDSYDTKDVEGKKEAKCKYCGTVYHNAVATRLCEHIFKCKLCPQSVKRMTPEPSRRSRKMRIIDTEIDDSPTTSFSSPSPSVSGDLSSAMLSTLVNPDSIITMPMEVTDDEVDEAVARAVYDSGVPLSMLESKYWRDAFQLIRPGYDPPNHHSLGGNLLTAEYQRIHSVITRKIEKADALGLISDGWTDVSNHSVVNFIVTTPDPILFKSICPSEQREAAQYIASNIISVIEQIGEEKFVAVVTDSGQNMLTAWRIIEEKFQHISCIGCAAHCINLLIKDVVELGILNELLQLSKKIIKTLMFSPVFHALFEAKQKEKYGNSFITLKLPCSTRWSSALICFQSLLKNKEAILETVVSPTVRFEKSVETAVLNNDMWEKLQGTCRLLQPISDAVTRVEDHDAVLSDVYEHFTNISKQVEVVLKDSSIFSVSDHEVIKSAIKKRQEFSCKKIHYAAYLLDPRYKGKLLSTENESEALDYIILLSKLIGHDTGVIMSNLAEFQAADGFFSRDSLWDAAQHISPCTWWKGLCGKQPMSILATKVFNIPPSSVNRERNWLAHSTINSEVRNGLSTTATEKLALVQWNLRYSEDPVDAEAV